MPLLEDIASIRLGYPFRRGLEPAANGEYRVVQIKDITRDEPTDWNDLVRVNLPDVREEHFVKGGDVLFISRGVNKQAVAVEEETEGTIVGSQFLLIKPGAGILPEYLAWYMNQPPAQRFIEENSVGSNVRILSREAIQKMQIVVPPLETQHRIVEVNRLSRRERQLIDAIQERRGKLVAAVLLKSIRAEVRNR